MDACSSTSEDLRSRRCLQKACDSRDDRQASIFAVVLMTIFFIFSINLRQCNRLESEAYRLELQGFHHFEQGPWSSWRGARRTLTRNGAVPTPKEMSFLGNTKRQREKTTILFVVRSRMPVLFHRRNTTINRRYLPHHLSQVLFAPPAERMNRLFERRTSVHGAFLLIFF